MSQYFKLLDFEIRRFRYVLFALMALTLVIQTATLIWRVTDQLNRYREHGETIRSAYFPTGKLSFDWLIFSTQPGYFLPVAVSIAMIGGYAVMIWYREWFGRQTFVYRLLQLPDGRTSIYTAKLSAILVFAFAMLAWQLLILPIEWLLFDALVPSDLRHHAVFTDVMLAGRSFQLVLPLSLEQFAFLLGLGLLGLLVLFTSILLERSYRGWGVLYGALYAAANLLMLTIPLVVSSFASTGLPLYPSEMQAVFLLIYGIEVIVALWLGRHLLNRKVSV